MHKPFDPRTDAARHALAHPPSPYATFAAALATLPVRLMSSAEDASTETGTRREAAEAIQYLQAELGNARALAAKLEEQHHKLRHELDHLRDELRTLRQVAHEDLDTVPLATLLDYVATYLDPGQEVSVTMPATGAPRVTVRALGITCTCAPVQASALLDAAAELMRAQAHAEAA